MGDGFYQALAHPIRREIIRLLKWSDLSAGEIANNFNISKPSISRHLEVLKNTEIIVGTRKGNQIIYSLNVSILQEMLVEIIELLDLLNSKEGIICHSKIKKYLIFLLSILAFYTSIFVNNNVVSIGCTLILIVISSIIYHKNIEEFTDLAEDNPKNSYY